MVTKTAYRGGLQGRLYCALMDKLIVDLLTTTVHPTNTQFYSQIPCSGSGSMSLCFGPPGSGSICHKDPLGLGIENFMTGDGIIGPVQ
jgi:hypothetical protein